MPPPEGDTTEILNEAAPETTPGNGIISNEFHETERTLPENDNGEWLNKVAKSAADKIKDLFIEKHRADFDAHQADLAENERVSARFPTMLMLVDEAKMHYQRLQVMLESYKQGDFAKSIHMGAKNAAAGLAAIESIAGNLAGAHLLRIEADKILKLALGDVEIAEQNLADFKSKNHDRLRRLGLLK